MRTSIIHLITLLLLGTTALGQKREPVVSIVEEIRSPEWYAHQSGLWEKEVAEHPTSESAWLNYYTATRMKHFAAKQPGDISSNPVLAVVEQMEQHIPGSFVFNYAKGNELGNWNKSSITYTKKAYDLEPENPLTYANLVVYYEVWNEPKKRQEVLEQWRSLGVYSPGLLSYHANLLQQLEPNAVIFTGGDNDTYPIWMLQDAYGLRRDVTVINRQMMGIPEHLKNKLLAIGITQNQIHAQEFLFEDHTPEQRLNLMIDLVQAIDRHASVPIYLSLSLGNWGMQSIESKLYNIGLANRYSDSKMDNIALLKRNLLTETQWDYLENQFYQEPRQGIVNLINLNYLPGLFTLHDHFRLSEDKALQSKCASLIQSIAQSSPRKEEILRQLKLNE